jgi:hypothetical protein
MSERASRTSSSLNGLMMAVISFMRVAALESELAVLTEQVTALETRAQTAPDPAREPEPGTSPEPGPA